MSETLKVHVCPSCGDEVHRDPHELRFQLVNASESAPQDNVDLHAVFHMTCAARVWTAAKRSWYGEDL